MLELTDKLLGWTVTATGAGGVLTSVLGPVMDDPKKVMVYVPVVASAGCFWYGIDHLTKAYSKKTYLKDTK